MMNTIRHESNYKKKGTRKIKILSLDIENSFLVSGHWGMWGVNISIDQLFEHGKVLCFAAKWLDEDQMFFARYDNPNFLAIIHSLLDEADAVLSFNGKRHDIPMLNREFIKAGMTPPSPYKQIDLYPTAKSAFKFPSNKMQHIAKELKIGQKVEHEGFGLWVKCLQGDEQAWAVMKEYNIGDVILLEEMYWKFQPWIANHPNHNLFTDSAAVCTNCGGSHLQSRGTYKTQTCIYKRLHCQDCGTWSRTRFTLVDKEIREHVYTGVQLF